jgi:hypothetical protein
VPRGTATPGTGERLRRPPGGNACGTECHRAHARTAARLLGHPCGFYRIAKHTHDFLVRHRVRTMRSGAQVTLPNRNPNPASLRPGHRSTSRTRRRGTPSPGGRTDRNGMWCNDLCVTAQPSSRADATHGVSGRRGASATWRVGHSPHPDRPGYPAVDWRPVSPIPGVAAEARHSRRMVASAHCSAGRLSGRGPCTQSKHTNQVRVVVRPRGRLGAERAPARTFHKRSELRGSAAERDPARGRDHTLAFHRGRHARPRDGGQSRSPARQRRPRGRDRGSDC